MHFLRRTAVALAASGGLALAGCGYMPLQAPIQAAANDVASPAKPIAVGWGRVAEQGLSIVPPAGWSPAAVTPPACLAYVNSPRMGFDANLNVVVMPDDGESLETTRQQVKDVLPKMLKAWQFVDDSMIEINGRPVYRLCSLHKVNGIQLKMLQYFVKGDNSKAYSVTFTAQSNRFDLVKGIFERSAQTIALD